MRSGGSPRNPPQAVVTPVSHDGEAARKARAGGERHFFFNAVGQYMSMTIAGAAASSTLIVARNRR